MKSTNSLRTFYIFIGLIVISFNPNFADPFNVSKQIALYVATSFLFYDLTKEWNFLRIILKRKFFYLLVFFFSSLLISSITAQSKYIAFFGENLRKNGFFTYACFIVILLYAILYFDLTQIRNLYSFFFVLNFIISGYGILQILGYDFVNWSKSAGIIGTLGNSNFAGVVYAYFTIISLGSIFFYTAFKQRLLCLFSFLLASICLLATNARQALLILIVGCFILSINLILKQNLKMKFLFFSTSIIVGLLGLFGIFNSGPLASILYKGSISIRIYYWKAALKMFFDHPLLGVGMDHYGYYFKQYRESKYPILYGFDLTSTNAHNVYLQFFATSGVIAGVSYVLFNFYVLNAGLKSIKISSGTARSFHLNIFALWIASQLQSLVSIDFIGVAIFTWFFAGIILSFHLKRNINMSSRMRHGKSSATKVIYQFLTVTPVLIMSLLLARVESNYLVLRNGFNPSNTSSKENYLRFAKSTLKLPLLDPTYKVAIANSLLDYQDFETGSKILEGAAERNPRDLSALWGLALYQEITGNPEKAIEIRLRIENLDPWNAKNYLRLMNDYLNSGKKAEANAVFLRIESFAKDTFEGQQARDLSSKLG